MSSNAISGMDNKLFSRLRADWERNHPTVLGLSFAVLCFFAAPAGFAYAGAQDWNTGAVYTAFFDLAAVFTAFLFGFYTFVVTSTTEFMLKVRKTRVFEGLKLFTISAMIFGGWVLGLSVPMMIIEPEPLHSVEFENFLFSIWAGTVVASMASFVRVTKLFLRLMQG